MVYRVLVGADGRWSVSNTQRTAVRRALSALQQRDLAFQIGRNRQGRAAWMTREQAERYAVHVADMIGTRSASRRVALADDRLAADDAVLNRVQFEKHGLGFKQHQPGRGETRTRRNYAFQAGRGLDPLRDTGSRDVAHAGERGLGGDHGVNSGVKNSDRAP